MNGLTVNVKDGALRGKVVNNVRGGEYYSFQGIPYAKPPVENLRFKAPQPPDPWEGIRDATKHQDRSLQVDIFLPKPIQCGSEDCLYLNVYTPENPQTIKQLKPVMVWIHGGAFVAGSGDETEYGPDYLLKEDVILMTFNYRLGLLGFLKIDDSTLDAPGNAGMKDMIMALKWIQGNIVHFGGDPDNVTVFGESAGGASIQMLILSPLAKGLFHRAIIESPPSLDMLAILQPGLDYMPELLRVLQINEKDNATILQKLREVPANDLLQAQMKIEPPLGEARYSLPTIEKASKEPAFLTKPPIDIIRSGNYNKVPLIFGYTSREGMLQSMEMKTILSYTFEDFIPFHLGIPKGSERSKKIAEEIRKFYFGGKEISKDTIADIYLLLSDTNFIYGIHDSLREHLRNISCDMYLYRFSFEGRLNIFKKLLNISEPGACHADELFYLFRTDMTPVKINPNSTEDLIIKRMTNLWANFAKFGNPNPKVTSNLINVKWQPVKENRFHYLEIGENLTVGINPDRTRIKFWDDVFGAR